MKLFIVHKNWCIQLTGNVQYKTDTDKGGNSDNINLLGYAPNIYDRNLDPWMDVAKKYKKTVYNW